MTLLPSPFPSALAACIAVLLSIGPQDGGGTTRPAGETESRKSALEWNDKGVAHRAAGKSLEAIAAFEKALEFAPGEPVILRNLGAAWNEEGVRLLEREPDYEKSIKAFAEALKVLGDDKPELVRTVSRNKAQAHDRRGYEYIQKNQYDLALSQFQSAAAADPLLGRYPTSIAYISFCKEDFDECARQLEAVVLQFPSELDAWMLLGEACYRKGELKRSLEAFEDAFRIDPNRAGLAKKIEKLRGELAVEGDFVPQNSAHFQFHFPPQRKNLEREADFVAGILNDAYFTIGRVFDFFPEGRTQVIFYEVKDFASVTRADEWVGALYDGKIRVPLRDFDKQAGTLKDTLFHEYTHRVVHALAGNRCPTWLNEGLAQISENANVVDAEGRLRDKAEKLLTATELKGPFVGKISGERARIAYDMSLSIAKYLQDQRGSASIARYLRALGAGDGKAATEVVAFENEFRMTMQEMLIRWRLAMNFPAEK
jgi:tetratricopeptide (TPR) repeat protein